MDNYRAILLLKIIYLLELNPLTFEVDFTYQTIKLIQLKCQYFQYELIANKKQAIAFKSTFNNLFKILSLFLLFNFFK